MPPAGHDHRAASHQPLSASRAEHWSHFGSWPERYFPNVVGLELEEVRVDYARMRLPYRSELRQPAGVIHGGAIATLIDTVVVPALASGYDDLPFMVTIDLQIRFLNAAGETDLIGEGWVTRRGRSVSFCQAEVRRSVDDAVVAEGWLVYKVSPQKETGDAKGQTNSRA
ncbi:MAG TPA: PaaI family thioesterase [Acidimicrobiales bacterium]|nr:PaaI family thioesterase [Acidimicrobiales bacterium]